MDFGFSFSTDYDGGWVLQMWLPHKEIHGPQGGCETQTRQYPWKDSVIKWSMQMLAVSFVTRTRVPKVHSFLNRVLPGHGHHTQHQEAPNKSRMKLPISWFTTTWLYLWQVWKQWNNYRNLHSKPEKAMAPHSSTLAWKIPWTEEPGGLQSMGSQRVRHDWATSLSLFTFMHWRQWQPTPVLWSDLAAAATI